MPKRSTKVETIKKFDNTDEKLGLLVRTELHQGNFQSSRVYPTGIHIEIVTSSSIG
jgi:hypothetical protein